MENSNKKEARYIKAKEQVAKEKKFYTGLFSSLVVVSLFAGYNYYTNQWENPWFLWIVLAAVVGKIFKAIKLFGINPFLGKEWEEKKINEYMKKDDYQDKWE